MTTPRWSLISEDLDREIRELSARITNMRPVWQDIGELLLASTERRFVTQTAPDGSKWAANKQLTIDLWLQREGRTGKAAERATARKRILTQSGALSQSLSYQVIGGGTSVEITSMTPYAGTHQFGAPARSFRGGRTPWGDIPARPFLGISKTDERGILETIEEHLTGAL